MYRCYFLFTLYAMYLFIEFVVSPWRRALSMLLLLHCRIFLEAGARLLGGKHMHIERYKRIHMQVSSDFTSPPHFLYVYGQSAY